MMQKLGRITFHNPINVVHAQLMLIDEEPVGGRFPFEKCDRAFGSPDASDQGAGQQGNDAEVSNEKCSVMFFPRPAR